MERFAPDVADAVRVAELVDSAAWQALATDAAREAYGTPGDEGELELVEQQDFAYGRLHGLSEAFGVLVGRDAQVLRSEALSRSAAQRERARGVLRRRIVGVGR